MSLAVKLQLSEFALDVAEGLSLAPQKKISPRYLYDDVGSVLFDAITLLPEYGLTRADERVLRRCASSLSSVTGPMRLVAELGSGTGNKTLHVLRAVVPARQRLVYRPIDVSASALCACEKQLGDIADVYTVHADWLEGLECVARERPADTPLLLLFLGSSIGNLERDEIVLFLERVRSHLRPGDFFLIGADLVKDIDQMIAAYDDPIGVTAAFNLNLLSRMNRELGANFDARAFAHEVRWSDKDRRIEMHLVSRRAQRVFISCLESAFDFEEGETIWTESSHKFTEMELEKFAYAGGFQPVKIWVDSHWRFAEALWSVD
jgi:dimethylhistidine N-methyltransferase